MRNESLKALVSKKICRSRHNVFLRSDFESVSSDYDQVGRALRELVGDNKLIRLGYGLYTKARINPITGKPMIAAKGGFDQVAKEALKRLNVKYVDISKKITSDPTITQTPPNTILQVKSRFNRKISVADKYKLILN